MTSKINFGGVEVALINRPWTRVSERLPYRKTYRLKPGDNWHDAEITHDQWEHYVKSDEGPIPVGAMIVRELLQEGAMTAVFTECWGRGCVFMGGDLVCVEKSGELGDLLDQLRIANGNRWRGLPDVIALFPDGRVAIREAKVSGKDRVSQTQHEFSKLARCVLGDRLDLAVVEWG